MSLSARGWPENPAEESAMTIPRPRPRISDTERTEVIRLLGKCRKTHLSVVLARAFIDGETPAPWKAADQIAVLGDDKQNRWRERLLAAWSLGLADLRPNTILDVAYALMRVVAGAVPIRESRLWYPMLWSAAASLPIALVIGLSVVTPRFEPALIAGLLMVPLTLMFWLVFGPANILIDDAHINEVRAAAAVSLGRIRVPNTQGVLAVAAFDSSSRVRVAAVSALKHCLWVLRQEHFGQLDVNLVPNLCRLLKIDDNELRIAVLPALAQIGDGRAITPLEQMRKGAQPDIVELIDAALPILREREAVMKHSSTLLRPASEMEPTLLRPVVDTGRAHDHDVLLRPARAKESPVGD